MNGERPTNEGRRGAWSGGHGDGDRNSGNSWRGRAHEWSQRKTCTEEAAGASSVMNIGGGDGSGPMQGMCRGDHPGESRQVLKEARDYGASANRRTYYVETKTENEQEHSSYEEEGT